MFSTLQSKSLHFHFKISIQSEPPISTHLVQNRVDPTQTHLFNHIPNDLLLCLSACSIPELGEAARLRFGVSMAVSSAFVACPKLETLLNHHKLETPLGRALPSNNRSRRGLIQRARCELSASDSAPNAANISALEQLKNSAADSKFMFWSENDRSSVLSLSLMF